MLPMVHPSKWPLQWFPQVIVGKVLTIKDLRTSWMMHSWGELQYPKDGLFRNSQSSSWGIIIICLEFQDSVGFCLQRWYRYALRFTTFPTHRATGDIPTVLLEIGWSQIRPLQGHRIWKPSLLWNRGINAFGSTSCVHFFSGAQISSWSRKTKVDELHWSSEGFLLCPKNGGWRREFSPGVRPDLSWSHFRHLFPSMSMGFFQAMGGLASNLWRNLGNMMTHHGILRSSRF
jgi:hypothetical protein